MNKSNNKKSKPFYSDSFDFIRRQFYQVEVEMIKAYSSNLMLIIEEALSLFPGQLSGPSLQDLLEKIVGTSDKILEHLERESCVPYNLAEDIIVLTHQLEDRKNSYGSFDECKNDKKKCLIAFIAHILPPLRYISTSLGR